MSFGVECVVQWVLDIVPGALVDGGKIYPCCIVESGESLLRQIQGPRRAVDGRMLGMRQARSLVVVVEGILNVR